MFDALIADEPPPKRSAVEVRLVAPVPPLPTASVPVIPVVSGRPVQLVRTPLAGVPRAGFVNVGLENVPPVIVFPVKVSEEGKDSVTAPTEALAAISFAVPAILAGMSVPNAVLRLVTVILLSSPGTGVR